MKTSAPLSKTQYGLYAECMLTAIGGFGFFE